MQSIYDGSPGETMGILPWGSLRELFEDISHGVTDYDEEDADTAAFMTRCLHEYASLPQFCHTHIRKKLYRYSLRNKLKWLWESSPTSTCEADDEKLDIALVLISNGAKVNAVEPEDHVSTTYGNTPLHCIFTYGTYSSWEHGQSIDQWSGPFKALLDAGADVNQGNDTGLTPLHVASICLGAEMAFKKHVDNMFCVVKHFVAAGGDLNVRDKHSMTSLHWLTLSMLGLDPDPHIPEPAAGQYGYRGFKDDISRMMTTNPHRVKNCKRARLLGRGFIQVDVRMISYLVDDCGAHLDYRNAYGETAYDFLVEFLKKTKADNSGLEIYMGEKAISPLQCIMSRFIAKSFDFMFLKKSLPSKLYDFVIHH